MTRILTAAVLSLAALACLPACSKREEYPPSIREEFLSSCLASAKDANAQRPENARLDDPAITRFCECTWGEIARTVSLKDFMLYENALKLGGQPDQAVVRALNEAATTCQLKDLKGK